MKSEGVRLQGSIFTLSMKIVWSHIFKKSFELFCTICISRGLEGSELSQLVVQRWDDVHLNSVGSNEGRKRQAHQDIFWIFTSLNMFIDGSIKSKWSSTLDHWKRNIEGKGSVGRSGDLVIDLTLNIEWS